uniref:Uncharacterized protein n=1 Tax=Heterorhabditis bacteriophora TaxID=37862 RepID=A0A1I7WL70_HETBA
MHESIFCMLFGVAVRGLRCNRFWREPACYSAYS